MRSIDLEAGVNCIRKEVPGRYIQADFLLIGDPDFSGEIPALGHAEVLRSPLSLFSFPIPEKTQERSKDMDLRAEKIAIFCSSDMAEFIFSLPALDAMRLAYPQAEVVLLGTEWQQRLLKGRPSPVDRVEVIPTVESQETESHEEKRLPELSQFFERMERERFDLAIQLRGGGCFSNPFLQRLHARLTVGSRTQGAAAPDRWVPYSLHQLLVLHYLEVVSLVGAFPTSLEPRLVVTPADLEESFRLVPPGLGTFAILAPGSVDPQQRWPASKFAAAGSALAWSGAKVVLVGDESDKEICSAIADSMPVHSLNLSGQLSAGGLAGLFSRAGVVVANNSGLLHLANATGAGTIGVYWCGNLVTSGPVTRARHYTAISWRMTCPECGLNVSFSNCGHQAPFVSEVSQEEVITSSLELLKLDHQHSVLSFFQQAHPDEGGSSKLFGRATIY